MLVVVATVANDTSSSFDRPCAVFVTRSPASVVVTAIAVVLGVPVPVTCIPVVIPVVFAIVIVVEPAVVVPDRDIGVTAPQFEETVMVCEVPSPRLLKIDSNSV